MTHNVIRSTISVERFYIHIYMCVMYYLLRWSVFIYTSICALCTTYFTLFTRVFCTIYNFTTSSITYEEYLVYPYKNKDYECIKRFKDFLETTETSIVSVDESVAERAAKIRAEYTSFRAMDALQLASACQNNCDVFVTNDKQLRQFKDIKIQLIDEL